jgi:Zn-finger nucleic acid-binding protein
MAGPPRLCPRCRIHLIAARGALMAVDVCTQCGGAFFDFGELAQLIRQHPQQLGKLDALVRTSRPPLTDAEQRAVMHCPACETGLEAYRYAGYTEIWLHECPQCQGTWADDGELQAVEAHVEQAREAMGPALSQPRAVPADGLDFGDSRWLGLDLLGLLLGRRWLF